MIFFSKLITAFGFTQFDWKHCFNFKCLSLITDKLCKNKCFDNQSQITDALKLRFIQPCSALLKLACTKYTMLSSLYLTTVTSYSFLVTKFLRRFLKNLKLYFTASATFKFQSYSVNEDPWFDSQC